MSLRREVTEYLTHLEKERDVSPHTVKAYGRDLDAFSDFCDRHYGSWNWETVDRLGLRGFLGELQRKGLSKRSAARALSAVRSFYRFLQDHHGVPNNIARAAPGTKTGEASAGVPRPQPDRAGCLNGPNRGPVATS